MGSTISQKLIKKLATLLGVPVSVLLTLYWNEYRPKKHEKVNIHSSLQNKVLKIGQTIDLLSWNIQFCGSRNYHFFYDGGPDVRVTKAHAQEYLQKISSVLQQEKSDFYLLQEIDRNSARTHYIDQLRAFLAKLTHYSWVATPYHRSSFVPAPFGKPLGKVDMHLGILSRFSIQNAQRHQLALLAENRLRQIFNLKRALLSTQTPIEGYPFPLHIGLTHLSAFSYGDGTLLKQAAELDKWMSAHHPKQPWILAGDFNMLPPGDDPRRLGEEHKYYADTKNPISTITSKHREAFGDLNAVQNRSYLPFGASQADRKIDYIFYGGPIEILSAQVLHHHSNLSDHLPLKVQLRITDKGLG